MALALGVLLSACGGGGAGNNGSSPAPAASVAPALKPLPWGKVADFAVNGNYTPFVVKNDGTYEVYSNTSTEGSVGELNVYVGTRGGVGVSKTVLTVAQITDVPTGNPANYKVRTSCAGYGTITGKVTVMPNVGRGYGAGTDGSRPSLAHSPDGISGFVYEGKIWIDGQERYVQTDSAACLVQEDKPAVLDLRNPLNNRYVMLMNYYSVNGLAYKLLFVVSPDQRDWRFARDAGGNIIESFPTAQINDAGPAFPTLGRAGNKYVAITADGYHEFVPPTNAHRAMVFCDVGKGFTGFNLVDANTATWQNGAKGTNLAYDPVTKKLMALTDGGLFELDPKDIPCPS